MLNAMDSATDATASCPPRQSVVHRSSDPAASMDIDANFNSQNQSTQVAASSVHGGKLSDSPVRPVLADVSSAGIRSAGSRTGAAAEHSKATRTPAAQPCAIPKRLLPTWLPPSLIDGTDSDADDDEVLDIRRHLRLKSAEEMATPVPIPAPRPPASSTTKGRGANASASGTTARARRADTRRANAEAQARGNRGQQATTQRQQPVRSNVNTRKRSRVAAQLETVGQESGRNKSSGTVKDEGVRRGERRQKDGDASAGNAGRGNDRATGSAAKRSRTSAAAASSAANSGGRSGGGRSTMMRGQFVKHESKKGWLVCKTCQANVWPPNCSKHAASCPAR